MLRNAGLLYTFRIFCFLSWLQSESSSHGSAHSHGHGPQQGPQGEDWAPHQAHTTFVWDVIQEVCGFEPYKQCAMELLKVSKDKCALKFNKKRVAGHTYQPKKKMLEELSHMLAARGRCQPRRIDEPSPNTRWFLQNKNKTNKPLLFVLCLFVCTPFYFHILYF